MGALAIPLMIMSAGMSIAGGISANAAAQKEAKTLKALGRVEADDKRREGRKLFAAQTVGFSAGGVEPTFGTPLDVLGDTVAEVELAALRAKFGRDTAASAAKARGKAALIKGFASAGATVLGGAAAGAFTPASVVNTGAGVTLPAFHDASGFMVT